MLEDYPIDILTLLVGVITIMSFVIGVFQWKIAQIKNDTKRHVSTVNNTQENNKDINQLKEIIISLQTKINDLCDRISRMEGAFTQHNREAKKE